MSTRTLLWSTVRRVTDGVARLLELRVTGRVPTETPGPACRWCRDRLNCPSALERDPVLAVGAGADD